RVWTRASYSIRIACGSRYTPFVVTSCASKVYTQSKHILSRNMRGKLEMTNYSLTEAAEWSLLYILLHHFPSHPNFPVPPIIRVSTISHYFDFPTTV
ncbi:hypothetical protein GBAR_LOCUS19535, partial [Geodia barretti]